MIALFAEPLLYFAFEVSRLLFSKADAKIRFLPQNVEPRPEDFLRGDVGVRWLGVRRFGERNDGNRIQPSSEKTSAFRLSTN